MRSDFQLLETLPVAIYVIDAEGRITFYNSAARELWGREPSPDDRWCASYRVYLPDGSPLEFETSPIARAVKNGESVRGFEAILERPDGTRIPYAPYPTPIRDENGKIVGAINMVVDLTERYRGNEQAARIAAIVSSSDDAIISKTLDGCITSWNTGAERIFGYTAEEMIGQNIRRIIPGELQNEEDIIVAQLAEGERVEHYETVRLAKDGRRVDISLTVSPMRDATGRVFGASKVARDVSERKRAEKTQQLLVDELHHRIKNTLATVQAIATQTLHRSEKPADFVSGFNGRIQAMARAHALLTYNTFQGVEASELVRTQLLLGSADDQRIALSGPSLMLEAQTALHLALVLHELGTNARKHGALSRVTGSVTVEWEVRSNGGRKLLLNWRETGGPKVTAPTRRGFGTTLIEQSLRAHGGEVAMRFAEDGVSCSITLPLPEMSYDGATSAYAKASVTRVLGGQKSRLEGKRVLIVEDEALIAMVLVDYLTQDGIIVVGPAHSVERAQALIAEETFDAALLDANLSGHRVDDLARAITEKGVPFAFVTGYGREALPQAFQHAISVDKPFTPEQVRSAIEQLLTPRGNVVPLKRTP